jgi:multiple sugar transport system substrate-binding protein
MSNIRPFQIVLIGIFGFLAFVALIVLSIFQSERQQKELAYGESVVIWGTLPKSSLTPIFQEIGRKDKAFDVVQYYQVPKETFDEELVNAIAEGRSPDLIVLKSDALVTHRAKLYPVPYETIPEREFRDTFVDGAEIFAFAEGIYGIPFAIDPLVLYWNRDLFSSNGLSQPPSTWEMIVSDIVPKLTVRDARRNITQSALAFGEYRNVLQAKQVLMLLLLQSGSKMVTASGKSYKVELDSPIIDGARAPFEAALQFYTDFSNVNSPLYSWNRALSSDKDAFIAGTLALYFGMGSELKDVQDKNPNLNFDIAPVPQGAGATVRRGYGELYAFAIPRASRNAQGAYAVSRLLSNAENGAALASAFGMSSARRDVIAAGDSDPYRKVIIESALLARTWYDPRPKQSDGIFQQMVEDIVSNRARMSDAVGDAINRLTLIY